MEEWTGLRTPAEKRGKTRGKVDGSGMLTLYITMVIFSLPKV
jgi:hypothetical protein